MTPGSTFKHFANQIRRRSSKEGKEQKKSKPEPEKDVFEDRRQLGYDVGYCKNWYLETHINSTDEESPPSDWPKFKSRFPNLDYQIDSRKDGHATPCDCCKGADLDPYEDFDETTGEVVNRRERQRSVPTKRYSFPLAPRRVRDDGLRCTRHNDSNRRKCKDLLCWVHRDEPLPKNKYIRWLKVDCRHAFFQTFWSRSAAEF